MTIFAKIDEISFDNFVYVSSGVFIVLLLLERLVKFLNKWTEKHGYDLLMEKTVNELMVLGLISFIVAIIMAQISIQETQSYFSFEFCHLTILFIGFAFVLQAVLLVRFVGSLGNKFSVFRRSASQSLIEKFQILSYRTNSLRYTLFHYSPFFIGFPRFREAMEFKIIEHYFVQLYGMPYEFNFAEYMYSFFRRYVIELVEVPLISWLLVEIILLSFVAGVRFAEWFMFSDEHHKPESVLCSGLMFASGNIFYLSVMYIFSSKYFSRLLMEALAMDNIPSSNKGLLIYQYRSLYAKSLSKMVDDENEHKRNLLEVDPEFSSMRVNLTSPRSFRNPITPKCAFDKKTGKVFFALDEELYHTWSGKVGGGHAEDSDSYGDDYDEEEGGAAEREARPAVRSFGFMIREGSFRQSIARTVSYVMATHCAVRPSALPPYK